MKERKLIFPEFPDRELRVFYRNEYDYNSYDAGNEYNFEQFGIEDGDTIVEVGTYTGGELMWFVARDRPLTYICVEPMPENCQVISRNLIANEVNLDVWLSESAIGGKTGTINMLYGKKGSPYYYRGNNCDLEFRGVDGVLVEMRTLDWLFEKYHVEKCKLLRMEPEHTDIEILEATSKKTLKKIDWIAGMIPSHEGLVKATKGLFDLVGNTKSGMYRLKRKE